MVATPSKAFQYPKAFNNSNMFHYPPPLEGAAQPTSTITASSPIGKDPRHDSKRISKQHQHKDFRPAPLNDFVDGTDLFRGENCFRHIPHQNVLPSRTGRFDRIEKTNNTSLDNILEHVQEWKSEFGITDESETRHRSAHEFERPDLVPLSPTSHTSCTTGGGSRMSGSTNGRYDVTRSLRKKGTGPAAAAATLLSHHGVTKSAARRDSNGSSQLTSDSPVSARDAPERTLSFSQLAARQRKVSFSELAAQRGVQW